MQLFKATRGSPQNDWAKGKLKIHTKQGAINTCMAKKQWCYAKQEAPCPLYGQMAPL